ncbi:MAG: cob(I)yrinic acid a,c-diamide adenosyltransferase [Candidatus Latescibacteria bacterium]|nr:cob(I)yrinic acid a,c-diamide adenosyltransferase [bacterium]MBD3425563.1 cob(I)yrinic acid a,c-diamide adenosyltransferase [Candidatus Latescibacterota bacterium]
MSDRVGTIQIYTGDGKGKTTAGIGAAVRAAGHGWKVLMIQFMKGRLYGEIASTGNLDNITIEQYGRDEFVDPENPEQVDIELALRGWERAREVVEEGGLDMLILDEINIAQNFGLIDLEEILEFMKEKPPSLELIMTGRRAHGKVIEAADTVTEMREIKHHYMNSIGARKGIEY